MEEVTAGTESHFERFFFNIAGLYRSIQGLRTQFAKENGIKSVHIFWIYLLSRHPDGLTASELAAASQTTGALVSREITELVEKKLLYTEDLSDRRRYAWKFRLTADGQTLAEKIDRASLRIQSAVSRETSPASLETFYAVLSGLLTGFTQLEKSNQCFSEEKE